MSINNLQYSPGLNLQVNDITCNDLNVSGNIHFNNFSSTYGTINNLSFFGDPTSGTGNYYGIAIATNTLVYGVPSHQNVVSHTFINNEGAPLLKIGAAGLIRTNVNGSFPTTLDDGTGNILTGQNILVGGGQISLSGPLSGPYNGLSCSSGNLYYKIVGDTFLQTHSFQNGLGNTILRIGGDGSITTNVTGSNPTILDDGIGNTTIGKNLLVNPLSGGAISLFGGISGLGSYYGFQTTSNTLNYSVNGSSSLFSHNFVNGSNASLFNINGVGNVTIPRTNEQIILGVSPASTTLSAPPTGENQNLIFYDTNTPQSINVQLGISSYLTLSSNTPLFISNSGMTFYCTTGTGYTITFPTPIVVGWKAKFIMQGPGAVANITFICPANTLSGVILGSVNGIRQTGMTHLVVTCSGASLGDVLHFEYGGTNFSYVVNGVVYDQSQYNFT
jgi:hypothetical protein